MASSVKPKLQPPPPTAARRAPTGPARPELLPSARALALGVAVAAPAPLNTPSRRREQPPASDATHSPAGPRWGAPAALADVPAAPLAARPAASDNVWASGHVAELLHPSKPAAATTVAKIQPSGRWGDDAVEQDMERRTRERQQARNREFPDLKEAAVIEEHRHEQHAHDRWGRADRFQRDDRFDRAQRGERYIDHRFDGVDRGFTDVPRRDGGLVGRWARDFNVQPNNAHPRFSQSDARFDMAPASRAAPAARPHPTAEPEMDVRGRYPSPPHYSNVPEDSHHHHEPRASLPDDSEKPNAAASPVQPADSQVKDADHPDDHSEQPAANPEKSPVAELPSPKHESTSSQSAAPPRHFSPTMAPMADRHKNDSLARYHDFRAPVWSHPARYDDPEDFQDPLDWRARPHGSARNSHRHAARPNEGLERERKMSSLSHTSSSSSSVEKQNATTDANMRILKRDAPKMLFDPKTGGMVSAKKDDKPKKPQQQQAQSQMPQAITRKQDQAGAEAEAVGDVLPQVEDPSEVDSPIATLVVGDVEVPIHDVPVVPMRLPIAEVSEPVEAESLEANRSVDKPKPRRRGGARQKKAAANRNLVYSDSHRSRSTSEAGDMKAPKRGSHSSASGSPSQPHTVPTRSKDDETQLSKNELKKNQVDRNEPGAAEDRQVRQQKTRSDSKRRVVVIESQPARSSRRDLRDGNYGARKGSHSIEEPTGSANGFQTTKSRREVLTETSQQPQEGSSPSKAEDERADNAKPKQSRRSRGGGSTNGHTVDDAPLRPRRTRGERTRQGHRTSGEQVSNSPDSTKKREPSGSGPNPRRNKSPVSSNGAKVLAGDPIDPQTRPDRKQPQQGPRAPSPAESSGEFKNGAPKDCDRTSGDNQTKDKAVVREFTAKDGTKPRRTVVRKVYVPKLAVAAPSLAAA